MRQIASIVTFVLAAGSMAIGHKTITSKYTYNEHVYPIVESRCARCHTSSGPTPMSLLTYGDALPWAESIREQMSGEGMPPWNVDVAGPSMKGAQPITAREIDILLTWASGGAPEGEASQARRPVVRRTEWKAGAPDLVLQVPPHTLTAGTTTETREVLIDPGLTRDRWIRLADLTPGTPSMVRSATVAVDDGPTLLAWVPGDDATPTPRGSAFRLPARTRLRVRIQYKKHWQDEHVPRSDGSQIGLYFTAAPAAGRGLASIEIEHVYRVVTPVRVVALRPAFEQPHDFVRLDAILPGGRRVPLLRLNRSLPGWYRRYWLAKPVDLPKNTLLELSSTPSDGNTPYGRPPTDRLTVTADVQPF